MRTTESSGKVRVPSNTQEPATPNRILIVDDNPDIHKDIKKILATRPPSPGALDALEEELFEGSSKPEPIAPIFRIDSALGGQAALTLVEDAVAQGDPYHVAFVDVRMPPGWDGITTIKKLWAADPNLQAVVCTAYSDRSWQDISQSLGRPDGWLVLKKPFDNIEVLQCAHSLTSRWVAAQGSRNQYLSAQSALEQRSDELRTLNQKLAVEINARKMAEANLQRLVGVDPTTGLCNRLLFRERLGARLRGDSAGTESGHLVVLNVHEKDIPRTREELNDNLKPGGQDILHPEADASTSFKTSVSQLAKALTPIVSTCQLAGYFEGGDFAFFVTEETTQDSVVDWTETVVAAVDKLCATGDPPFHLDATVGIASYPEDNASAEGLLICATTAADRARVQDHGTVQLYSDLHMRFAPEAHNENATRSAADSSGQEGGTQVPEGAVTRAADGGPSGPSTGRGRRSAKRNTETTAALKDDLAKALAHDELTIVYQPQFDLQAQTVTGLEALLRWEHPEKGSIPPLLFTRLAEESGNIVQIGRWVLQSVARQLRTWREQGLPNVPVAVNLSSAELQAPRLAQTVEETLDAQSVAPHLLHIEITETTAIRDLDLSARVLSALSGTGVSVVIDNFGSGSASLRQLRRLPVDAIKIDRSFTRSMASDRRGTTMVGAIVALARCLGIRVIASGVETQAQLERLQSLRWNAGSDAKCQTVQGFLLSRPLPASEVVDLLEGGQPRLEQVT